MYLTSQEIADTERLTRLNLINAVSGIKSANLIGTRSEKDEPNLAIFSSVVHIGSDPALLGFILRPDKDVRRHTFENILATELYTINHVHESIAEYAHCTSAKFEKEESEFSKCGIEEEYLVGFDAPFVKTSSLKRGMKLVETVAIRANDTRLVIGEIRHLIVPDHAVNESGQIDLEKAGTVGVSGLDSYYRLKRFATFPYARADEVPNTIATRQFNPTTRLI